MKWFFWSIKKGFWFMVMVMFSHVQSYNILVGLFYIRKIIVGLLVNVLPGALLKEFFLVCPIIK